MDDLIRRSELLEIIEKELEEAREGVTWTNATCFKNKVTHLRNFRDTVKDLPGFDPEGIIKTLKDHKYHHAAEIVKEALKNE